jgi:hypothetical protein
MVAKHGHQEHFWGSSLSSAIIVPFLLHGIFLDFFRPILSGQLTQYTSLYNYNKGPRHTPRPA